MEVWTDDEFPDKDEENVKLIGGSLKTLMAL